MKVGQALVATSYREVEIGLLRFRVRRVTSRQLFRAGAGFLVSAAREGAAESDPEKRKARIRQALEALARNPAQSARQEAFENAVLAAGVIAASIDGGKTWEPLQVVLDPREEDVAKNCVCPWSLPPGTCEPLVAAILELSNGGAASKALATFLGRGAEDAGPAGA